MDQKEMLEKVKALNDEGWEHRKRIREIEDEIHKLKGQCNHTKEDGTSAIEDVYDSADQRNERECQICGACWNVFGVRL